MLTGSAVVVIFVRVFWKQVQYYLCFHLLTLMQKPGGCLLFIFSSFDWCLGKEAVRMPLGGCMNYCLWFWEVFIEGRI